MGLSLGHILIVLVILLLFGSRRLPELGKALGKSIRAFKEGIQESKELEGRPRDQGKKNGS